jgi:hypothetical protein
VKLFCVVAAVAVMLNLKRRGKQSIEVSYLICGVCKSYQVEILSEKSVCLL